MTRKYVRNVPEPVVCFEYTEPERILYTRGAVCEYLTGFFAWLYRGMIWMYGEDEARERFWWMFHEKSGDTPPETAAQTL